MVVAVFWQKNWQKKMNALLLPLFTFFTIDTDFMASTTAYVGELYTDLKLLIILVIGLPIAFWVIRRAIGLVRAR